MAERPIAVNFDDVGPNDGLDGFRSEADISLGAQPVRLKPVRDRRTGNASGVALAARNSRYLRVWAAALTTVFLVVAIGASLLMPSLKQEDSADTPRARDVTAQPQPQQLDNSGSARAENTAANDAALT